MGGVIIHKIFKTKNAKFFVLSCLIIGVALAFFWKTDYTVYRAPFNILCIDLHMIKVYIYRFTIGLALSSVVIYFCKMVESSFAFFAKYGQYSLAVYTGSFVINSGVALLLSHINYHTNQMFLINVLPIVLCTVIYIVIVLFGNLCRKQKMLKLLFLGE